MSEEGNYLFQLTIKKNWANGQIKEVGDGWEGRWRRPSNEMTWKISKQPHSQSGCKWIRPSLRLWLMHIVIWHSGIVPCKSAGIWKARGSFCWQSYSKERGWGCLSHLAMILLQSPDSLNDSSQAHPCWKWPATMLEEYRDWPIVQSGLSYLRIPRTTIRPRQAAIGVTKSEHGGYRTRLTKIPAWEQIHNSPKGFLNYSLLDSSYRNWPTKIETVTATIH